MRIVVIVLALLAGLKVWTSEHMYRSATEEALVAAYRGRATAACQKDAARGLTGAAAAAAPALWGEPATVRLVVGKPRLDVAIWDVDNPLWAQRYKHPFLVLTSRDKGTPEVCTYDVMAGLAEFATP